MEKKVLDLPLKKEWYNMIESGVKTEEYREIKPYWCNRLLYHTSLGVKEYWTDVLKQTHQFIEKYKDAKTPPTYNELLLRNYGIRDYTHVRFRYGYTKRTMTYEIKGIVIGRGKEEWGHTIEEDVFIIKLGEKIDETW